MSPLHTVTICLGLLLAAIYVQVSAPNPLPPCVYWQQMDPATCRDLRKEIGP